MLVWLLVFGAPLVGAQEPAVEPAAAPEMVVTTDVPDPDQPVSATLLTVAPGEIYWERFGHNALIIGYGDGRRISYNFGYFDFEQPGFLTRFLRGDMRYLAIAFAADDDLSGYLREGRSVRLQSLSLPAPALQRLDAVLRQAVSPAEREYRYDYYRRNCSTRIRDALDEALDGALRRNTVSRSRGLSLRDFTLAHAAPEAWLYVGTHLGLSSAVDRPVSIWEEQFLPARVADAIAELPLVGADGQSGLVRQEQLLGPDWPGAPTFPERLPWWIGAGLLLATLFALPGLVGAWARGLIAVTFGLVGATLLGLWLGTDHWAAAANENILLFSPLWWWALPALARRQPLWRSTALRWTLLVTASALVLKVLPAFDQQNWEWIWLMAAPWGWLAWRWWRAG
ncbi:MAG: DUF4105 domain-containing protein [Lysobacterales bacterium]